MQRVSEALLIFGIVSAVRIERATVVSGLDFPRDLRAIWVAMVQQQFAGPQPARIKVGQIATRPAVSGCIRLLVGHEHSLHVEPHASGEEKRQEQAESGIFEQRCAKSRSMLQLMRANLRCDCESASPR